MSDFGFGKKNSGASEPAPKGKGMDLSGLPTGAVSLDPARERDAVQRGEALGFTDRGQSKGGRRKRPPPAPTQTIFIRAPEELAQWFERYTEGRGHRALWQSIQDFRELVESGMGERRGPRGEGIS